MVGGGREGGRSGRPGCRARPKFAPRRSEWDLSPIAVDGRAPTNLLLDRVVERTAAGLRNWPKPRRRTHRHRPLERTVTERLSLLWASRGQSKRPGPNGSRRREDRGRALRGRDGLRTHRHRPSHSYPDGMPCSFAFAHAPTLGTLSTCLLQSRLAGWPAGWLVS